MNHDSVLTDGLQNNKMAHVPVHDRWQAQLPQVIDFKAQWAAGQMQVISNFDQSSERHPFERNRVPLPQRIQVDLVSIVRGEHGHAGEPALSRLRLQNDWKSSPSCKVQKGASHPITSER